MFSIFEIQTCSFPLWQARIPANAELVDLKPYGRFEVEPAKNDTLAKVLLIFRVGSVETQLPLFVKFQTSRGTDSWFVRLVVWLLVRLFVRLE